MCPYCVHLGWTDSITSPSDGRTDSGVGDLVVFHAFFLWQTAVEYCGLWTAAVEMRAVDVEIEVMEIN